MITVCCVTPAYGRYDLTRICLAQRRWAFDVLKAQYGIEATTVVIADDENVNTAIEFGFEYVESPNYELGRKFNDGFEYALTHGYDWVMMPLDSESFISPEFFKQVPDLSSDQGLVARLHTLYTPEKRAEIQVNWIAGTAYIVPINAVAKVGGRPCDESILNNCVTSAWNVLREQTKLTRVLNHSEQLDLCSFRTPGAQITSYKKLVGKWGLREVTENHFDDLLLHYPSMYVDMIKAYYGSYS